MHGALGIPFTDRVEGKTIHFGLFVSNFILKEKVIVPGESRSVTESTFVGDSVG
jgi:hypothetical protein